MFNCQVQPCLVSFLIVVNRQCTLGPFLAETNHLDAERLCERWFWHSSYNNYDKYNAMVQANSIK